MQKMFNAFKKHLYFVHKNIVVTCCSTRSHTHTPFATCAAVLTKRRRLRSALSFVSWTGTNKNWRNARAALNLCFNVYATACW